MSERSPRDALRQSLRLIVITDRRLARPRTVTEVVASALDAGVKAVQLRAKDAPSGKLLEQAAELLHLTRPRGALLFVNDRVDVALASGADGVHLGPDDLPLPAVRALVPSSLLVGYSTDDPKQARWAEAEGADYIGCGAVWSTGTKDVGDEAIGVERLAAVATAVQIPVVAIGGVTVARAAEVPATGASGTAAVGAVMSAEDPAAAVRALLQPWRSVPPGGGRRSSA